MGLLMTFGIVLLGKGKYIENGGVVFDSEGKILDVGKREELERDHRPELLYGCRECIVMPGLINAHTHLAMTLMRGFPGTVSGFSWLRKVWEIEKMLRPEHIYAGAMLGIAHSLKSGITTVSDHYYFAEETARAALELGARAALARTFMDLQEGPPGHDTPQSSFKFAESFEKKHDLISTFIGPHALYTCSDDALLEAAELSKSSGIRIHIHMSESRDEVENIMKRKNIRPIAFADEVGILEGSPLLAHVAYADEKEISLLSRKGASVAYAPFTKMRGGQEISPAKEMIMRGTKVGLATDGPASVYSLDMFREMRFMLAGQNHKYRSPSAMEPSEVFDIATMGGARALGMEESIGSLEKGKKADIVVLKLDPLKFWPQRNPYQAVVYAAEPSDVEHVFVNGKLVVEGGKLVSYEESKILEIAEKALSELVEEEKWSFEKQRSLL
ncbi:MAG: amidohydrolase family protein [Fervidicoccaceae archaeon]